MLTRGKEYDDGDEPLAKRKIARMNIRATALPTINYIDGIDDLKRKIKQIGGV